MMLDSLPIQLVWCHLEDPNNPVSTLEDFPIDFDKPSTQFPCEFLIKPPQSTTPGFPIEHSSVRVQFELTKTSRNCFKLGRNIQIQQLMVRNSSSLENQPRLFSFEKITITFHEIWRIALTNDHLLIQTFQDNLTRLAIYSLASET